MTPTKISDKLLSWASDMDGETIAQASRLASLPFIVGHVALMPDAHVGIGATVGSVIATSEAIIPASVGVDIGCGMIAAQTNLVRSDLPEDLSGLLSEIARAVPAGVGEAHSKVSDNAQKWLDANPNDRVSNMKWTQLALEQFGTLGSGNHFIEISVDSQNGVWIVLHSGSRGVGNKLAQHHINVAKALAKRWFVPLPDPDLAFLPRDIPEFGDYIVDLQWAQAYAAANREQMLAMILRQIKSFCADVSLVRVVNCHHNYMAKEHHMGKDLWITRKGAIRARVGDFGVIPGSMGTDSYIVRGLGNPASFCSASHGAGRRLSRSKAKQAFTEADLAAAMVGKTWLADEAKGLVDEIPQAYKDIVRVMEDQADLVEIETRLVQVLSYKGVK